MLKHNFQRAAFAATFACLLLILSGASAGDAPSTAKTSDVDKLLEERLALLREIAQDRRKSYESGQASLITVLSSELDVLAARLELAKMQEDKIAILEETLKSAGQLEEITTKLVDAGETPRTDLLQAKAFRLKTQADLMRLRPKEGVPAAPRKSDRPAE